MNRFICLLAFLILTIFIPQALAQQIFKGPQVYTQVGDPKEPKPGSGGGSGEFVYYCQGDPKWNGVCNLGESGCGPTSLAMIISSLTNNKMTPAEVDSKFLNSYPPARSCSGGSAMPNAYNASWFKELGLSSEQDITQPGSNGSTINLVAAKQVIENGGLILGSSHTFPCANCKRGTKTVDHIFVVDSVDISNNTVNIRDPNNCDYSNGSEFEGGRTHKIDEFPWAYAIPIHKIK